MPTQAIVKLQLSLMGLAIVPDTQWIGDKPFRFEYQGDKIKITDTTNGITKLGDTRELLKAMLADIKAKE